MIHLSVAVGEFFKILLTALFSSALSLLVVLGLAVICVGGVVLAVRAIFSRRR